MNKTGHLHDLGQSLWLDSITREILDNGTLRRYLDEFSLTGLLAIQLQRDGAQAFVESWKALRGRIADKGATLVRT